MGLVDCIALLNKTLVCKHGILFSKVLKIGLGGLRMGIGVVSEG
jgi:hypothetical protein